jgi:GH24 family phage-related lysozyme (muramidase)
MANSTPPGPAGTHHKPSRHHKHHAAKPKPPLPPARTPSPLGHKDAGDPSWTSLLGWTPNLTGLRDWADQTLHRFEAWGHQALGAIGLDHTTNQPAVAGSKPLAATPDGLDWEVLKKDYVRWEGKVPYMYLDSKSLVTVGIGRMLPNVAAAQQLPFVHRSDGKAATADEIKTDFENVKKQPGNQVFTKYKPFTTLELKDDYIFELLKTVHDSFQADLRKNYTGYDKFPLPARRALTDMVYNLGIDKLLAFHHMNASIAKADWAQAAKECHRNGPSAERNDWTKQMFEEAAK